MILMKKKLSKLPNQKSSATIQPHKNRSMRQFKWDHLHPHPFCWRQLFETKDTKRVEAWRVTADKVERERESERDKKKWGGKKGSG